jgi:hypothetical protein
MNKLEQKRRKALSKGYVVELVRENKRSNVKDVAIYDPKGNDMRPFTHIYVYQWLGTGKYMVWGPGLTTAPLAGLTYRQAVQVAYMVGHRRKGM